MMTGIDALPAWADSPATWAFALLFIFAMSVLYGVVSGRLVPRKTVDSNLAEREQTLIKLEASWDARLAEAVTREQGWRDAYNTTEAARDVLAGQLTELLVLARTTDAVLRALPLPRDRSET